MLLNDKGESLSGNAKFGGGFPNVRLDRGKIRLHDSPGKIPGKHPIGGESNAHKIIRQNLCLEDTTAGPYGDPLRLFLDNRVHRPNCRPLCKEGGRKKGDQADCSNQSFGRMSRVIHRQSNM